MTKKIQTLIVFTLILSAIIISSPVVMAEDANFIYPANKSVISISKVRIIGKTGDSRNLSLHVENSSGKNKFKLTPAGSYFSSEIQLTRGKNTISLSADSNTVESIDIIHDEIKTEPDYPEDFSPYYLHSENDLTAECELCHTGNENRTANYKIAVQQVTCITGACHAGFDQGKFPHKHNPHGSGNKDFAKYFRSSLCFSCHTELEGMAKEAKDIHFPVAKGECTVCHDPHKSDLEYRLKAESIADLCAGCHGDIYTSYPELHEPVEAGDCNACHVPHISDTDKLTLADGNDLCFSCHKFREQEFASVYVHEPVAKDCKNCHDPHGSVTINHLRNRKDEDGNYIPVEEPIKELCINCHRKDFPELVDQIENGKVRHEPIDKGKCTDCHTPHSTNHKKQLIAPLADICFSCHKKKKELITGSINKHGPVRSNDCGQCHLVHGAEHDKLLRAKFSKAYSVKFNLENYALCFNCHESEMVLKEESSQYTGFRNGRKNLHYLHVYVKDRNCKTCHEMHASDQDFHLREKIPFNKRFNITLTYNKKPDGGTCVEGCHKPREYNRIKPVINK
jgi:predicted CXXCH cytochrome family protein